MRRNPPQSGDSDRAAAGRTRRELRDEVDLRRLRVWELAYVRKLTDREIAQVVGVSRATVARDISEVRKRVHKDLRDSKKLEHGVLEAGAELRAEITAVIRQAWTDCMAAAAGSSARARFLNVVLKAGTDRVKLMQSLGLMEKIPEEWIIGEIDLEGLSDTEARQLIALFRESLTQRAGESGAPAGGEGGPPTLD